MLPDGHDISVSDLPEGIPVLLGHFHGRSCTPEVLSVTPLKAGEPLYIGATDRKAWGEWQNPTGAAVLDT